MRRHLSTANLFLILMLGILFFSYRFVHAQSHSTDLIISGEDGKFSFSTHSSAELEKIVADSVWSVSETSADRNVIHRLASLIPNEILMALASSPQVTAEESSVVLTFNAVLIANRPMSPDRVHISGADSARGFGLIPIQ